MYLINIRYIYKIGTLSHRKPIVHNLYVPVIEKSKVSECWVLRIIRSDRWSSVSNEAIHAEAAQENNLYNRNRILIFHVFGEDTIKRDWGVIFYIILLETE